jgi:hypothetical protein
MIPLSFAVPGELIWSKIPHHQGFELKQNGEVVARLNKPSFWSCGMQAEAQGGRWTLSRTGFWRNTTVAVDEDSKATLASLTRSWSGVGTLTFSDGQTFHLSPIGFWRMVWEVKSTSGQPVIRIDSRKKRVELVSTEGVSGSRVTLLAMFAWQHIRQEEEDAASAAIAVVVTS